MRARRTASQSPSSFPASLPRYSLTSIVRQKQPSPRRSSVILSICEADWITPITKSSLRFIKAAHCPTLLASLSRQRAPLAGGLPRSLLPVPSFYEDGLRPSTAPPPPPPPPSLFFSFSLFRLVLPLSYLFLFLFLPSSSPVDSPSSVRRPSRRRRLRKSPCCRAALPAVAFLGEQFPRLGVFLKSAGCKSTYLRAAAAEGLSPSPFLTAYPALPPLVSLSLYILGP